MLPSSAVRVILGLAIAVGLASCSSPKQALATFHLQGNPAEGTDRMMSEVIGGREVYFLKQPLLTNRHFSSYWNFPADDGTNGVAFKLNLFGKRQLQGLTAMDKGKMIRSLINLRKVGVLRYDGIPTDGYMIVWSGITDDELLAIDETFDRIDDPEENDAPDGEGAP